jgi:hypothetical protein
MKLLINKERFIQWYFDYETQIEFFHRYDILGELKDKGVFSINLKDILDNVGYLPQDVAEDGQDVIIDAIEEIDINAYDEIEFS